VREQLVALGSVGAPHGLNGELRVKLHNPGSELLAARRKVWLRASDAAGNGHDAREARVRSCRRSGVDYVLLGLEGVDDRDAAQALRGCELCLPRAELPPLAEGEHYLIDLIGLRVVLADGTAVGVVEDAFEYPAAQVLRVATEHDAFELPLREPYLIEIRAEDGEIVAGEISDLERLPARSGAGR
jgi:16S rRNA processing protein RimM